MKTLLILRHAKARKEIPPHSGGDADRPLNDRGRKDAKAIGELLAELEMVPQVILTSSARRARKTATRVAKACRYREEIIQSDVLYLATPPAYVEALNALPKSVDVALVVGHNPGLEQLVLALTGRETKLSTAALAEIELPIVHWSELVLVHPNSEDESKVDTVIEEGFGSLSRPGTLLGVWRPREVLDG